MSNEQILLGAVLAPFAGSFLLPIAGWVSPKLRNALSLFFCALGFACSAMLVPVLFSGQTAVFSMQLAPGFNIVFTADALAVFMALVSSFISSIIILYSFGYISHYKNQNEYYFMAVLFLGSMMGLIFSANLILLYIFWEITAITSWRLIGFFREKTHVLKADKAFLVTVFGALMMLIGFIMIYQQAGSFDLNALKNIPISNLAVILILTGIFSKSATLPFHTWLPDAGVAPSPVTALLHAAVLVKIGVYVFARLFLVTFTLPEIWHTVVPVIAALSAVIAAGAALMETDLKRIIAYSTISQIGFIFFGFAVNSRIGIIGALLYILMHGLAKAGLFLCAGIVEQNTKIKDVTKLGGLLNTMPLTAIAFLLCSFSVMGIPPFGGFFSKYMVFAGAITARQYLISGAFLVIAFMTILYLLRVFNLVFLGDPRTLPAKEGSRVMVASVVILAVLSLVSGLLIIYPYQLAGMAVTQMLGVVK